MARKANARATEVAAAPNPAPAQEPKGNRPVKEIRLGRVRASIWQNTNSKQETWFSVVLTRGYKDGDQWKNSHSLGLDDLLVAGEVLRQAALWVYAERQGEHRAPTQVEQQNGESQAHGASDDVPFLGDQQTLPAESAGPYNERL